MFDFLYRIFDTAGFPERWHCGQWSALHGWTHIIADTAIFAAYTAIPCVLAYFVLRRRDVPFLPVFWLFVAFIFSCGFGHLVEATLFWQPWYRFSGLIKVITAVASWSTVVALVPILPRALALPGLNQQLEQRVSERTAELETANHALQGQIAERERAELALKTSLNEKEALLREIHHRVKNNLQVIASLLSLQSDQLDDPAAAAQLQESQNRVHAMALIHESLYQMGNLSRIDFADYARMLASNLLAFYGKRPGAIRLVTDVEPVFLSLEKAMPCGLILGELVSNCLKHAFPAERQGQISIELHPRPQEEERRQFDARLQQTQKLESLGVLAGGIAHDFNNLLTVVINFSDLALREVPPGTLARAHIERAIAAANHAAKLTQQLLAYAGKGRFVIGPVHLSQAVRDTADILKLSISKQATLVYQLTDELPLVQADVTQFRQVLLNLVINASEALGDNGGTITIATGVRDCERAYLSECVPNGDLPAGRYVFLEVADPGCGMAAETVLRIFEPFFTTKFIGRGLGLAAVLGIVGAHKGGLRVASAPGFGSTFTVLLHV